MEKIDSLMANMDNIIGNIYDLNPQTKYRCYVNMISKGCIVVHKNVRYYVVERVRILSDDSYIVLYCNNEASDDPIQFSFKYSDTVILNTSNEYILG